MEEKREGNTVNPSAVNATNSFDSQKTNTTQIPSQEQKPVSSISFNSEKLMNTKAKEKREIFVNVENKKSLKENAEEFQKKFMRLKNRANESNKTEVAPKEKKPFPVKKLLKILIPLILIIAAGIAVYANWDYINYNLFEVSEKRAKDFIKDNPNRYISIYDSLINKTNNPEEKSTLLLTKVSMLEGNHPGEFAEQCLKDVYQAEELYPSYTSAELIINMESKYGSEATAEEWKAKLSGREGKVLVLGDG